MLPSALIDLTLLHTRSSGYRKATSLVRLSHAAAVQVKSQVPDVAVTTRPKRSEIKNIMTPRDIDASPLKGDSSSLSKLKDSINTLKTTVSNEDSPQETMLSEDDLLALYADVLATPPPSTPQKEIIDPSEQSEIDTNIILEVEERLLGINDRTMIGYKSLLEYLNQVASQLTLAHVTTGATNPFSIGILTSVEWTSLVRQAIHYEDVAGAETLLDIMKKFGIESKEDAVNVVLDHHVNCGNISAFENVLGQVAGTITETQKHLHVKVHLKATQKHEIPVTAMSVLHAYENAGSPAPMKSYNSTVAQLFSVPSSSIAKAQAWDLFAHMRYVAYPNPDVIFYSTMIRACASPVSPSQSAEPERALDLWTEMTVTHKLTPDVRSYNCIILACARSGEKDYVNEAFRIAKMMLDSSRDAFGESKYLPNRFTIVALLEGAKRIGDLARARWILAEMVQLWRNGEEEAFVDAEIMRNVFHAYATYNPPLTSSMLKVIDEKTNIQALQAAREESSSQGPSNTEEPPPDDIIPSSMLSFKHIPPQTSREVIAEVETFMTRITEDRKRGDGIFQNVVVDSQLLNAYLSVLYKNTWLSKSRDVFWAIYEEHGVKRTARDYRDALTACAYARARWRLEAYVFANEIMEAWGCIESTQTPRVVERMHVIYIRLLAQQNELDRAMEHLKGFVKRYPASYLRQFSPRPAFRDVRTVLAANRPLVRLTSTTEVPDDNVPPLLVFHDLELLFHRLTAAGRKDDIDYITHITKSYEWMLRVRRDEGWKAAKSARILPGK